MTSTLLDSHNLSQTQSVSKEQPAIIGKDDVFVEPQTLVRLSGKTTTSGSALLECQSNMGPLTTPTKARDPQNCEPWTPTSNLKMLISAASPEIRNREKELSLDSSETEEPESSMQESGAETEKLQISRKEKSLGLLCHKFLARYPDYPNPAINNDICLDDVATELNVERRRIYDIMNVLESLHMVSRLAKNRYTWHGRTNLPGTLAILRKVGAEHRYEQQMQQIRQRALEREEREFDLDMEEKENEEVELDGESRQRDISFVELPGVDFKAASVNSRKDKSLRVMSQKFVMLFLVSTTRAVSLEIAAKILIGEDQVADQDKSKFKTKIRRLYDIANVLSSLELIKKVHLTEERGRKPAFKWTGPEDLPSPKHLDGASLFASSVMKPLESRSSIENCAKNLFCSPGVKRGFTRHHSLVKLVRTIQDDRRKINSAPASPVKNTSCDSPSSEFYSSKMAQLAAICKSQLDEQSNDIPETREVVAEEAAAPVDKSSVKSTQKSETVEPKPTGSTRPQYQAMPPGAISYLPSPCPSVIPVLLPQHQVGGSYAVYVHPASLRPHPSSRPPPTSLAVRSMTFESPGGANASRSPATLTPVNRVTQAISRVHDPTSPAALKRVCSGANAEGSPSKVKRTETNSKGASPKLCEILQARLKARRVALGSGRPSSRALHLDPEFTKPPESRPPGAGAVGTAATELVHNSVEKFLEKEEKVAAPESEAGLTPLRPTQTAHNVPVRDPALPQGHLHTETLIPAGYLIPISQQSLLSYNNVQCTGEDANKASTPTYVYRTPTAGSRPPLPQEFTPTGLTFHRGVPLSPFPTPVHRVQPSPSPAILNFTLQNLGLISPATNLPGTPAPVTEHAVPPHQHTHHHHPPGLPQQGMIFVKPLSPAGSLQPALQGQPLTLISVQQPLVGTPKGTPVGQHNFFHTPVSLASTNLAPKSLYIPQRRLEVSSEEP